MEDAISIDDMSEIVVEIESRKFKQKEIPGGFSPTSQEDIIKCPVCSTEIQIKLTDTNQDLLCEMHMWLSPFCPKVKELPEFQKMNLVNTPPSDVDYDRTTQYQNIMVQESREDHPGFFYPPPVHSRYSQEAARTKTFHGFQGCVAVADFVHAGFYLNTPPRDKVTCFWCDGSLESWNPGEKPLTEHAKYYPGCSYLRQIVGTSFIYSSRNSMIPREVESSRNLRYSENRDIRYPYYQSYREFMNRSRSLLFGGLSQSAAHSFSMEGFHWNDEKDLLVCYYCGLRIAKDNNLHTVKTVHKDTSPKCEVVLRGDIHPHPQSSQDDYVDYLICSPCKCFVKAGEYSPTTNICPRCRKAVRSHTPFRNSARRVTLSVNNVIRNL